MKKFKKATLYIKGMHCPSCDILIKDKFSECANIKSVKADHQRQTAEVEYTGQLHQTDLNNKISAYGYSIVEKDNLEEAKEPFLKKITEVGTIAFILFILYFFAKELNFLPEINTTSSLGVITALVLGVVASTSTCMATSGALFLATIGNLHSSASGLSKKNIIFPALSFTTGRVLSYAFFGFVVGMIGKIITFNQQMSSLLTLVISVIMVLIGLNMLQLISFSFVNSTSFTKGLFEKLEKVFMKSPKKTSFFLGAITYLLPCGFTQSVQLYALSLADPVKSSVLMTMFALGTVPMLLALGFASSFTRNAWFPLFQKAVAIIIVAVGVSYIFNFAILQGVKIPVLSQTIQTSLASTQNGKQIIKMSIDSQGYTPNVFTVKAGTPVRWEIEGKSIFGCQSILMSPQLHLQKTIALGQNVVEFTPTEKGTINFSCSMGMYRGQIEVI